jgi:predicted MFS family arabinose efflux permease
MNDRSHATTRIAMPVGRSRLASRTRPRPDSEPSLLRSQGFRSVFTAAAVSTLGTQISFLAVPLLAVSALNATPAQLGALGILKTIAFLVVGLPAGAWLDRIRRRGVMVAADLARAALLASVPVAWWLHILTIEQLYLVVLLTGLATLFFDVAALSYLPFVAGRDRLTSANSALQGWDGAASVAGPSIAGYLVQLASAPVAVLIDAATYLWSAAFLAGIRRREPQPERTARRLPAEIREGVRFVFTHPLLRPIALVGAGTNLFIQIAIVIMPLMFKRVLGLPAGQLGLFFAVGGIGMLFGSLTANRLARRFGPGPALSITGLVATPFGLLVPLIARGPWLWVAMCGWLLLTYRIGTNNVILVSLRQQATPDRLLSRMNATMRFLMTGVLAIGAALGGAIGQYAGTRTALWVAAAGLAFTWLPLLLSPLRRSGHQSDEQRLPDPVVQEPVPVRPGGGHQPPRLGLGEHGAGLPRVDVADRRQQLGREPPPARRSGNQQTAALRAEPVDTLQHQVGRVAGQFEAVKSSQVQPPATPRGCDEPGVEDRADVLADGEQIATGPYGQLLDLLAGQLDSAQVFRDKAGHRVLVQGAQLDPRVEGGVHVGAEPVQRGHVVRVVPACRDDQEGGYRSAGWSPAAALAGSGRRATARRRCAGRLPGTRRPARSETPRPR